MTIKDIATTIKIKAEYNPALMMVKTEEQLDQQQFSSTVQQLQHRCVASH